MLYLRMNETPDDKGQYNVWFDLDRNHETFIKVDRRTVIGAMFKQINDVKDAYCNGLLDVLMRVSDKK